MSLTIVGKTKQSGDREVRRPACDGTWKTTSNWLVQSKRLRVSLVVTAFLRDFAERSFYLPKTDKNKRKGENEEMNKKKALKFKAFLFSYLKYRY